MIVLGLTGSIGMGKTTAAAMFRAFGVPIFDADLCVHDLYSSEAVDAVEGAFPGVLREGKIDRGLLADRVLDVPAAMAQLEAIVHPLVVERRMAFLAAVRSAGARLAVLDVPLLFETRAEVGLDAIAVVTADAAAQRQRVLARQGMTEAKFSAVLKRQMTDVEKRLRAHFIIQTSEGFDAARRQIKVIIAALAGCEYCYRTN